MEKTITIATTRKSLDFGDLVKKIGELNGVESCVVKGDLIFFKAVLEVKGEEFKFIDVGSTITDNGYVIIHDSQPVETVYPKNYNHFRTRGSNVSQETQGEQSR